MADTDEADKVDGNVAEELESQPRMLPGLKVEVFVVFEQTHHSVRSAQRNRAFARMTWKYKTGGLPAAIEYYKNEASPDLLIVESDEVEEVVVAQMTALAAQCRQETRVFFVGAGAVDEVALFRRLMKIGVNDFLRAPVEALSIIASIKDTFSDVSKIKLGRVTAFLGAGGGTGSSTIAHNVASVMANLMGTKVLLADFDPQFGTVGLDFNIDDAMTLTDILHRRGPIDELLVERIATKFNENLSLLLVEPTVENLPNLPMQAIEAIISVANVSARHVVLDMTHVWSPRTSKVLCRADNIVVTTMPTLAGLRNAEDLFKVIRRVRAGDGDPILVLNKVRLPKRLEIDGEQFRDALDTDEVFQVPFNAKLFSQAQADSTSIVEMNAGNACSEEIIALARHINGFLDNGDTTPPVRRLFSALRKWW